MFNVTDQWPWIKMEVEHCKYASKCCWGLHKALSIIRHLIGRLHDGSNGRNETVNLYRTRRLSIRKHQTGIVSGLFFHKLSMDCLESIHRSWFQSSNGVLKKCLNMRKISFPLCATSSHRRTEIAPACIGWYPFRQIPQWQRREEKIF